LAHVTMWADSFASRRGACAGRPGMAFSTAIHRVSQQHLMPAKTAASFFHLHLVSDSTGETLIKVARAAAAQYSTVHPVEHVYPAGRTNKQLDRVLDEIEREPGVVLYTLLEQDLIARLEDKCREVGVPCL